jgi:hypothetical protein
MADPVIVQCIEKVWTKVVTAATTGKLRLPLDMGQFGFRWTYRDTGGVAPANGDDIDGGNAQTLFDEGTEVELSFPTPADVYVRPRDANDEEDATADISVALP